MNDGTIYAVTTRDGTVCALFAREMEAKIYHQTRVRRATAGEIRRMRIADLESFLGAGFDVELVGE